jgi:very-short-patch-repair endonuclease
VDLASRAGPGELERAVARGLRERVVDHAALRGTLTRHRGRRGARLLRRLLDSVVEPELTRSVAETRLLELVRAGGLPRPRVNARVEGFEVDFLWSGPRLVVEVDGFAYHGGRVAFERDRDRDASLAAAGYRVVRVTWRQLDGRPSEVLVRIAQALTRGN